MSGRPGDWVDGGSSESPPNANGELLFEAPWEARAFGMAHALCDGGRFTWDEFRAELIAEIARWERETAPGTPYRYYERWLAALTRILEQKGLADAATVAERARTLAERPHGHDHH